MFKFVVLCNGFTHQFCLHMPFVILIRILVRIYGSTYLPFAYKEKNQDPSTWVSFDARWVGRLVMGSSLS